MLQVKVLIVSVRIIFILSFGTNAFCAHYFSAKVYLHTWCDL